MCNRYNDLTRPRSVQLLLDGEDSLHSSGRQAAGRRFWDEISEGNNEIHSDRHYVSKL